jgi:hypothetical protein
MLCYYESVAQSPVDYDGILKLYEHNYNSIHTISGNFEFKQEIFSNSSGKWSTSEHLYGSFGSEGFKHRFDLLGLRKVKNVDLQHTGTRDFASSRVITSEKDVEWIKNRNVATIKPIDDGVYYQLLMRIPQGSPYSIPDGEIRSNLLNKLTSQDRHLKYDVKEGKTYLLMTESTRHPTISGASVEIRNWLDPEILYYSAYTESYYVFDDAEFKIGQVDSSYNNENGIISLAKQETLIFELEGGKIPASKIDFVKLELIPHARRSTSFGDVLVNTVLPSDYFELTFPKEVTVVDKISGITIRPNIQELETLKRIDDQLIDDVVSTGLSFKEEFDNQIFEKDTMGDGTNFLKLYQRSITILISIATCFTLLIVYIRRKSKNSKD